MSHHNWHTNWLDYYSPLTTYFHRMRREWRFRGDHPREISRNELSIRIIGDGNIYSRKRNLKKGRVNIHNKSLVIFVRFLIKRLNPTRQYGGKTRVRPRNLSLTRNSRFKRRTCVLIRIFRELRPVDGPHYKREGTEIPTAGDKWLVH